MKTYTTTVSSRKQTSVPSALGLKGGEKLVWEEVKFGNGGVMFQVYVVPEDPVGAFYGCTKDLDFGSVEDLLRDRRRDRRREQEKDKCYLK